MTRLLLTLALLLTASSAGAMELTERPVAAFPPQIRQIFAADTGAYLYAGGRQVWFIDAAGTAREIPIPLDGLIQGLAYEPTDGVLWGCTEREVFATNAGGLWQSWSLGAEPRRQRCDVAPSPGGNTWVVISGTDEQGPYVEVGSPSGVDLGIEVSRMHGAIHTIAASDAAGGMWVLLRFPQAGLAHFDGRSWRVWSPNPLGWTGTEFLDVFVRDRPIAAETLAPDGVGGLVAPSRSEFVFVRSTSPVAAIDRVAVSAPGFTPQGAVTVGAGRIWAQGASEDGLVLASWDFSGHLASAEPLPTPTWFDLGDAYGTKAIGANAAAVWVASSGVLFRRGANGWTVFATPQTIERLRRARREAASGFLEAFPLVVAAAGLTALVPWTWSEALDVGYGRAVGESALGWAFGTFGHWLVVRNDPWRFRGPGPYLVGVGLVLNVGIATAATIVPEAVIAQDGDPFPIGGAVLGAAAGYGVGLLVDGFMELVGIDSRIGRAVLWSSFTAVGAPLGFHAMRRTRLE